MRNQDGPEVTLYAVGNLSTYQFHIMVVDANGYAALATDPDLPTEGGGLIGILQNTPAAAGREAVIRVDGVAKVMSGAAINEGVWVTTDGSGHAAVAVAFDNAIGISLTAGASGYLMEVLLKQCGLGFPA